MASSSTALLRLAKIAGLVPEPSSCAAQSLVTIALSAQGVLSKENSLPVHWYFRNARPTFEWRDGGMAGKSQHGTILYVGGFALPDGNAAAQRVVANARLFAKIGYKIAFLNYSKEVITPRKTEYFGFECFECPDAEWRIASRLDIDRIKEIVSERSDIKYVIAYNYPAPSLSRLIKLCRERGIKCFGDVTEWYRARDVSLVKMPLKYIDTVIRMKWLHPKMDGLIVISEYLRSYYGGCVPTLLLPPMVDADDDKWRPIDESEFGVVKFVYAGKPSKTKERLDLIVDAVVSLPVDFKVRLDIVGVTAEEFSKVYGHSVSSRRVVFHGRVPHEDAVGFVKRADYSVIVRDDNLVTRAGFPSKFAESISCGTPVICNDNSDLKIWVEKYGCGFVVEKDSLTAEFACILKQPKPSFDVRIFDYRNFRPQAADFFNSIDSNKEN